MEVGLDTLVPGEVGTVVKVKGEGSLRRRLLDMGITPEAKITVKKMAPLGDPMEVNLRGYELSIRKSEAQNIIVNKE